MGKLPMPSDFLLDALQIMKLRNHWSQTDKMRLKADQLQLEMNPAKPSITMASVFYLSSRKVLGIQRSQLEISKAFGISSRALTRVNRLLHEEVLGKAWEKGVAP